MVDGTFDARLSYAIEYPSRFLGSTSVPAEVGKIALIDAFDSNEDIRHTTFNSITEAHLGLVTIWGEFTGSFVIPETSPSMALIEELRQKQLYFDLVIVALDSGGGTDYKVEAAVAVGCKMGGKARRHRYGEIPKRTYQITYCRTNETLKVSATEYHDIVDLGSGNVRAVIGAGEAGGTGTKVTTLTTGTIAVTPTPVEEPAAE